MWQDIALPWQTCFEEAWSAYCHGSLPHGAVVTDASGKVLARGRNCIYEKQAHGNILTGNHLAHAEMNALLQMDWSKSAAERSTYILYSSIEPCPMCIGAVRLAHFQQVHYALRDNEAGGSTLVDKTEFFSTGNITIIGSENATVENILLAIQLDAVWNSRHPSKAQWGEKLSRGLPLGAQLGRQLYQSKQLQQWRDEGRTAAFVVNHLAEQVSQLAS